MRRLFCWKTWWSVNPHYQINSSRSHCSLLSLLLLLFVSAQHLITPSTAKGVRGNIGISRTTSRMFATLGENKRAKTENPIDPSKTYRVYILLLFRVYLSMPQSHFNWCKHVQFRRRDASRAHHIEMCIGPCRLHLVLFFDLGKS